jgi:kynureninase
MTARWDLERARALDDADPLAEVRRRFVLPHDLLYLDGNSLGALGSSVAQRARHAIEEEWGQTLAASWSRGGWMDAPVRVGDRIARLIGARPGEVLVADTTSISLAKLVGAALSAQPSRRVVLSTTDNFPSDLYAAAGAARLAGATLRVVDPAALDAAMDEDVAVCCLTHVDFRTGALHSIPEITQAAHGVGALMLWDLCHSAGAVPVGCEEHGVDLAVGCTYKYLNGGPGAPSFLYVRRALQDRLENPLPGWLGHGEPFGFGLDWRPAEGIRRFLTSTPPVLALAALDAALDALEGVGIGDIRKKSVRLGEMFIEMVQDATVPLLEIASPLSPDGRGSQISLRHPRAGEAVAAASDRGAVGDFRPPDICRFGLAAPYLSYEDVFRAAEIVIDVARSLADGAGAAAARSENTAAPRRTRPDE